MNSAQSDATAADWVARTATAALLALEVAAIGVTQLSVTAPTVELFLAENAMPPEQRARGIVLVLCVALATGVGALVAQLLRPTSTLVRGVALVLAPALVLPAVPALFVRRPWADDELGFLIIAGVAALVLERLLRVSFGALGIADISDAAEPSKLKQALRRWLPPATVLCFATYYAVVVAKYTVLSHFKLATSTSDLGEFDNLFFNALSGHPFRAPAIDGDIAHWSALKVHAEFALFLLLPFYAVRPGPEALLIIQTVIVAATAIPIYLFAARRLTPTLAVVPAVALLLLPVVQRPNFYDFHFTPVAMFWVAWTIYFVDRAPAPSVRSIGGLRRAAPALVCFALALLTREDAAIGLVVLGAVVAFSRHNPMLGGVMLVTATGYFVVIKFLVMPAFGTMPFDTLYEDLKAPGQQGYRAVVETLVTNPLFVLRRLLTPPKLLYLAHFTVPLLFLWTRRPVLLLAALPGFVSTLLVTTRPPHWESSFQYTYLWVPYVVAASVLALQATARRGRLRVVAASVALAFVSVATSFQYGALLGAESIRGGPAQKTFSISMSERIRYAQLLKLTAMIPPEASVAATELEGPHVSTRRDLYSLKVAMGDAPDFLLLGAVQIRLEREHVFRALSSGQYGVVARQGPFTLLKRGADPAQNVDILRELEPVP